jgi:phage terminase large subunit-like protein
MSRLLGYNGNKKLRRAFLDISLTQYQLDEFKKCSKDPIYFIKNYVKIISLDKGIIPFDLYPFQEDMVTKFINNRFVICKIPRQSGKTITTVAFLLHSILFNENYNVAILAHKGSAANGILARLKLAYENLPNWLQSGIVEWNKGNIELENGSKISAHATSADGLRSGSYNIILLDEFAFVQNTIAEEFFTSTYPVITAGTQTKIIIVSTPRGMNLFYTMWIRAEAGKSDYLPIEVHWSAVPGRDEKWKEQTIRNTSEEQFQQEYMCLHGETPIEILDTLTNEIKIVTIEELYNLV